MWADIARNMFMPLFIPPADFVVGNPPWVNHVPRYAPANRTHRRLAELSRHAHAIAAGETAGILADVEREVDECAAAVWGLTAGELSAVQRSLRE